MTLGSTWLLGGLWKARQAWLCDVTVPDSSDGQGGVCVGVRGMDAARDYRGTIAALPWDCRGGGELQSHLLTSQPLS